MVKLFTSQVKREKGKIQRTKTSSKVSKINTGLIEYIPKTLVKKTQKKTKHVDIIFNSIQPLPLPITNAISNTNNNQIPKMIILKLIYQHLRV